MSIGDVAAWRKLFLAKVIC